MIPKATDDKIARALFTRVRLDGDCIRYTGAHDIGGYGRYHEDRVHRLVFILSGQVIPPKHDIDHVRARGCLFKDCINLAHLEPVTRRENLRRGDATWAINERKTHCPQGHELAGSNLIQAYLRRGHRVCKICEYAKARVRARRYYHEKKAAVS